MNILIAEDNTLLQETVEMLMTHWGFEFDIAANGRKAIELAAANEGRYDLCLMDIDMPVVNGFEATRTIRSILRYLPIVALTGFSVSTEEYRAAGMDDYLQKPYAPSELYDKIAELTVKSILIQKEHNRVRIGEEKPMSSDDLKELVELKKKGLTRLKIVGVGDTFVVHKNIQNKISYDLIGEGKELSEFLDRSEKEPGRCHLYKMNLYVTKDLFTPEELEDAIKREDQIAERFDKAIDRKLPELVA